MSGRPKFRRVTHYLWVNVPESEPLEVPATEWWITDPEFFERDGKRYISVAPEYWPSMGDPDVERLECGHEQPVRIARGRKYYNRRRRCDACAARLTAWVDSCDQ